MRQADALDRAAAVAGAAELGVRPRSRARRSPARLAREAGDDPTKRLASRVPPRLRPRRRSRTSGQRARSSSSKQREVYAKEKDADSRAWADLCQMLFASNAFLYVE